MATETTITRQAPYIEALGEQYGKDLTALTAKGNANCWLCTYGCRPGSSTIRRLHKEQQLQGQGIGAYQPYLTQAGAYSGPTGYQPISEFMSPYQQDVIDTTMGQYDIQAQKGLSGIGSLAAKSGNLGGGREGVMRSEYQTQSDLQRAMLMAQLQQQGFGQAQQGKQLELLDNKCKWQVLHHNFKDRDIATLGSAGAIQQAQTQATLDAQREANRLAAYEPYERLGYMGAGLGNVLGGMGGQYQTTVHP